MSMQRRERGTGTVTRRPNGKWQAIIEISVSPITGMRRRVTATGRTKNEALTKARDLARQRDNQPYTPHDIPTVTKWADTWLTTIITPHHTPNTIRTYRFSIQHSITPSIGSIRLDQLRPRHARQLEQYIIQGDPTHHIRPRSGATAQLAHTILKSMLDAAVGEGYITHNPLTGMQPPAKTPIQHAMLTMSQAYTLIHMEPDPQWRLLWHLLYATGIRYGEALGLTVDMIDLTPSMPTIIIGWQLQYYPNMTGLPRGQEGRQLTHGKWLVRPKSQAGRRVIPIPDNLRNELATHIHTHHLTGDQLVFTNRNGDPMNKDTVWHAWRRALDRARLPHVRLHSARHTVATRLDELGVSDATRIAIIGHSSITVTNSVYTHPELDTLHAAIDRLNEKPCE